jgi:hypothetical protein
MKKYSSLVNLEQIIVGAISLTAIPIAVMLDTSSLISNQTTAVITSRIMIAVAYGAGGIFALVKK